MAIDRFNKKKTLTLNGQTLEPLERHGRNPVSLLSHHPTQEISKIETQERPDLQGDGSLHQEQNFHRMQVASYQKRQQYHQAIKGIHPRSLPDTILGCPPCPQRIEVLSKKEKHHLPDRFFRTNPEEDRVGVGSLIILGELADYSRRDTAYFFYYNSWKANRRQRPI